MGQVTTFLQTFTVLNELSMKNSGLHFASSLQSQTISNLNKVFAYVHTREVFIPINVLMLKNVMLIFKLVHCSK